MYMYTETFDKDAAANKSWFIVYYGDLRRYVYMCSKCHIGQ